MFHFFGFSQPTLPVRADPSLPQDRVRAVSKSIAQALRYLMANGRVGTRGAQLHNCWNAYAF
jgi:protein tyrosine phosphatase (PTP) superfamily phosphohydrolase (DUF442 family)